jgi:parallel beta-helix repeat protein
MRVLRTSAKKPVLLARATVALFGLLILAAPLAASAETRCVTTAAKSACPADLTYTSITAAVNASSVGDTIQVAKGTYAEDVTIGKSLFIVGANQKNTIIDATGKGNGFFIDGVDDPGVSNVVISGFTVKNANFEGILVADASSVTISDNIVSNNNKSLNPGMPLAKPPVAATCPGIPEFETSEDDDCGEGIHLLGADHSIVSNNLVQNNAGGILISDDTAIASNNFITGNTVQKNSFDCGITMASHPRFGGGVPFGVLQNTITDNLSTQNGLAFPGAGAGAGVGIFDSVPGTTDSGNVVVGNTLTKNGLPGVTMHSHTTGQNLTNNVIVGNTISGNAADTMDAVTSGPTGINLYGVSPASGTIISGNTINNEMLDVVVNTPTSVDVHFNNLLGKNAFGVQNSNAGGTVNATQNFWGCPKGPPTKGCSQIVPSTGITVFPVSPTKF